MFVDDFYPEGFYHVITIRSPVSGGRLLRVETPKMPAAYTLITASDIPGTNRLEYLPVPVLADEKISYIGEPVALLAGPDISKLTEYAEAVTVHVADAGIIPDTNASIIPDTNAGIVQTEETQDSDKDSPGGTSRRIEKGTLKNVLKKPNTIIEGTYKTGIQEHWYSDPHGAAAFYENETLIVFTSTQWPFHVKRSIASLINIKPEFVAVRPAWTGIHLDGKLWYPSLVACHAALAASIVNKAVKLSLTRDEDFLYSPKRNAGEVVIKSALNKKGELVGNSIQIKNFAGSCEIFGEETLDRFCLGSLGSYILEPVEIDAKTVLEPIPPQGPFAGFGLSQGFFAIERHVSQIADTLNIDPLEWRQRNILLKNNNTPMEIPIKEHIAFDHLLETAASMSDYHRKWASYELLRKHRRQHPGEEKHEPFRGIGVSLAYQGSGFINLPPEKNFTSVELTLDKDSILEIRTSMVSTNNDCTSLWKNTAAEILSLAPASVKVTLNNTELVPDSGPSSLSRNITVLTKLIERSCLAIRKQRFRDPLPITVKKVYTPLKTKGWNNKLIDQNALNHLSWAAAVVEVEIDPIEYIPKVRGIWTAVDGGKILSEQRAKLSLKTAVIQALGWAAWEELSYKDGRLPPDSSSCYAIPTVRDVPPIAIDFLWNDSVIPRGIGELPFNTIPAAYAQALTQAADCPFNTLPVTAERVWQALSSKEKKEEES